MLAFERDNQRFALARNLTGTLAATGQRLASQVADIRNNPEARRVAAETLGALGPLAGNNASSLARHLNPAEDRGIRRAAAQAIGQFGPAARESVLVAPAKKTLCANAPPGGWVCQRPAESHNFKNGEDHAGHANHAGATTAAIFATTEAGAPRGTTSGAGKTMDWRMTQAIRTGTLGSGAASSTSFRSAAVTVRRPENGPRVDKEQLQKLEAELTGKAGESARKRALRFLAYPSKSEHAESLLLAVKLLDLLSGMTYDADSRIRGYALEALGRALCLRGPGSVVATGVARPHCARLAKLLETEVTDDDFRRAAARIFADMAPEGSEPHSESLAKALLKDPDAEVRRLAIKALEGLGIGAAPYEEHLVIALNDRDEMGRGSSATCRTHAAESWRGCIEAPRQETLRRQPGRRSICRSVSGWLGPWCRPARVCLGKAPRGRGAARSGGCSPSSAAGAAGTHRNLETDSSCSQAGDVETQGMPTQIVFHRVLILHD
ncbi:unnamed protein product [Polarella glacialis]|uniref:HEAT repeat domain-containing protein n=1 Tax=Polarella glacialis TaxID=89957 RepID=A0A813EP79_POLGL|nr:unnamed protein product [Polarella glacialis]